MQLEVDVTPVAPLSGRAISLPERLGQSSTTLPLKLARLVGRIISKLK